MIDELTIGNLIKRYIKMRGRTAKEVSVSLNMNYTTFCGILNRDAVDAKLLFQLANLLDLDLDWMSQFFGHHGPISPLAPYHMPRMQSDFRQHNYPSVIQSLDTCIRNNPDSISDARKELLTYHPNLFYLLDVLLPEEDIIRITVERKKEKFHCIPVNQSSSYRPRTRGRSACYQIYEGNEALNLIIAARKEELK